MKHINKILLGLILTSVTSLTLNDALGQSVGISDNGATPDPNSLLDINVNVPSASNRYKGVLLPRMTTAQRGGALGVGPTASGDLGMIVYTTDAPLSTGTGRYTFWNGTTWKYLASEDDVTGGFIINTSITPGTQTPGSFDISATGTIGTALTVGTTASVASTLAVGQGIRVGDAALTPVAGQGNILTTVDGGWIGRGAALPRIAFDATATTENIKVFPVKQMQVSITTSGSNPNSDNTNTAYTIENTAASNGVGMRLIGNRGSAPSAGNTREVGFIDFANSFAPAATLGRLGVTNPSANTQGRFHISLLSGGSLEERLFLAHDGNLTIDGKFNSQGIQETSDARFKKNIAGISNALSTVLSLEGVTYNWRTEEFPERSFTDRMEYGVIAQQIEKFVPELVSTDENGYKSVQYSHMVPLLLEAIKEQQDIINSQSKELGVLKASVEAISEYIKTAEK